MPGLLLLAIAVAALTATSTAHHVVKEKVAIGEQLVGIIANDRETLRYALCGGLGRPQCDIGEPEAGYRPSIVWMSRDVAQRLGFTVHEPDEAQAAPHKR